MPRFPLRPLTLATASLIALGCDAGDAPLAEDDAVVAEDASVEFAPVNRSGITGTVTADHDEEQATVTIELTGLEPGATYPVHLHTGRCAAGGPVAAPLGRITAGADSTGRLNARVTAGQMGDQPAFVQAHDATGAAVSCADLPGHAREEDPLTERVDPDSAHAGHAEGA